MRDELTSRAEDNENIPESPTSLHKNEEMERYVIRSIIYARSNSEIDELTLNASDMEQVPALSILLAEVYETKRRVLLNTFQC